MTQWLRRLALLFPANRRRKECDLEEELQSHLELATDDSEPGNEALSAARRQLGNQTIIRESTRSTWGWEPVESLFRDVLYGVRGLRRTPVFTIAAILTLALSIGANTAIFSLLNAIVLRTLPVHAPQQLSFVEIKTPHGSNNRWFSQPLYEQMKSALPQGAQLAALTMWPQGGEIGTGEGSRPGSAQLVSLNFFSVLGVAPALGRDFSSRDNNAALISYRYWVRQFGGSPSVLGKTIRFKGTPVTVVGVTPREFLGINPGEAPDLWLPVGLQHEVRYHQNFSFGKQDGEWKPWSNQPYIRWLSLIVRAPAGSISAATTTRLEHVFEAYAAAALPALTDAEDREQTRALRLVFPPASKGFTYLGERSARPLFALLCGVVLVLLIACANLTGLLLTRSAARGREMTIRLSLGASRGRLARQAFIEAFLLSGAGGLLGAGFSFEMSHLLLRWSSPSPDPVPLYLALDRNVLLFCAGTILFATLLLGLLPALASARTELAETLKAHSGSIATSSLRWGRALIAGQVACCFVLLYATGLLVHSLVNYLNLQLGFRTDHLLSVYIDPMSTGYTEAQLAPLYDRILQEVRSSPGVAGAALSFCDLLENCISSTDIYIDRRHANGVVQENTVSPGYFSTIGMTLVRGRLFNDGDHMKTPAVVIVNQTMARKYFPNTNPIGRRIAYGAGPNDSQYEIVGVVQDARINNVHEPAPPMVYHSLTQQIGFAGTLAVHVSGTTADTAAMLKAVLHQTAPNLPVGRIVSVRESLHENLNNERLVARLAGCYSFLALVLACLGLYGVTAYQVTRRVKEIGIRIALGANRAQVLRAIIYRVALLPVAGLACGIPIALLVSRAIRSQLYGVSAFDSQMLLLASAALLLSSVLASLVPAERATRIDPTIALRYE
jgi:predicted permease